MTRTAGVLRSVVAFIVGDDWRIAAGVGGGILLALILHAWEVTLATVFVLLAGVTLTGARRRS